MADISMDFDARRKLATEAVSKMYGSNFRTLEMLKNDIKKEYTRKGFTAKNIYGVSFEEIAEDAQKGVFCAEQPTTIEQCIRRDYDLALLKGLCKLGHINKGDKFNEKVETVSYIWTVIQLKIIPTEVAWAMQLANQTKDVEYTQRHQQVYNYLESACQKYLTKTQAYADVLEQYRAEKKLNF